MNLRQWVSMLGPGLLYAGAAVGVSHLVQSTRAGANYGWDLVWVVIVVNLIKYPVFELGPRYAAATGETLLHGYKKLGSWAVWVYMIMTLLTTFIVMAAISIVTSGLFIQLTGIGLEAKWSAVILLGASVLILGIGHYNVLDNLMKAIVILLTVSTLIALGFALSDPITKTAELVHFDFHNHGHILFLVALIGWMPAPVDISIWHSVWSVSKNESIGKRIPMKTALTDFKIGYWGTMVLAVCFVALGALVMHGSGETMSDNAAEFAGQLIRMYTANFGDWAFPVIALAAFTTMFSTLLTCLDAFPRTMKVGVDLISTNKLLGSESKLSYWIWIIITATGTSVILTTFLTSMKDMVDFATTMSFVLAPVFALLSFLAMNHKDIEDNLKPPRWLRYCGILSIILLSIFSIWFIAFR